MGGILVQDGMLARRRGGGWHARIRHVAPTARGPGASRAITSPAASGSCRMSSCPRRSAARLHRGVVGVDVFQRTTVPEVFAAGEVTGIGGLDRSLVEGEIAGLAASGDEAAARFLFPRRDRARRFAAAARTGLRTPRRAAPLPRPETIVCRCEDVAHGSLTPYSTWTEAKLQTRCGMGPCQGRVCGAAAEFLYGWARTSIRPPIFPTALGHLAGRVRGT